MLGLTEGALVAVTVKGAPPPKFETDDQVVIDVHGTIFRQRKIFDRGGMEQPKMVICLRDVSWHVRMEDPEASTIPADLLQKHLNQDTRYDEEWGEAFLEAPIGEGGKLGQMVLNISDKDELNIIEFGEIDEVAFDPTPEARAFGATVRDQLGRSLNDDDS